MCGVAGITSGSIVNVGNLVGYVSTPWARSYCAGKASMQAMSNSLRLKLRPFGVNVVLVLPSSMRSNLGRANLERLGNYEWKLYKDFKEVIEERARASQDDKAMDGRVFARHVVRKVLGPKPPKQIVFLSHDWFVCLALMVSPVGKRSFFLNLFWPKQKGLRFCIKL